MKKNQLLFFVIALFIFSACSKDDGFKGFTEIGVDVTSSGDEVVSDVKILVYDALNENAYVKTINGSNLTLSELDASTYNLIAVGNSEGVLENKEIYSSVALMQDEKAAKNLYAANITDYKFPAELDDLNFDLDKLTGMLKIKSTDAEAADYDSLSVSVVVPKGNYDLVGKAYSGDAVTITKGFKTEGGIGFDKDVVVFPGTVAVNLEYFKNKTSVYTLDLGTAVVEVGTEVAIEKEFNEGLNRYIQIPDANFRALLKRELPDAFDGDIFDTEHESISSLTDLFAMYENIVDFTGLKYLTGLTTAYLDGNSECASELDLTRMKDLQYLYASYSPFTKIDVTGLEKLEQFTCELTNITTLDVSTCKALTFLDFANSFKMPEVIIGDLPLLTMIVGYDCILEGTVDLTGCPLLETVYLDRNNLEAVDFSGLENLKDLGCSANNLATLNLSGCSALKKLDCTENDLTSLDLSASSELTRLNCSENLIGALDLSGNTKIEWLSCYNNALTSVDLTGCDVLEDIFSNDNKLTSIDLSACTSLQYLIISNNELSSLDLGSNIEISGLECKDNKLAALNLSGLASLQEALCANNAMSSLDVTGCTMLKTLDCVGANQTFTDITGLIAIDLGTELGVRIPWSAVCGSNVKTFFAEKGATQTLMYENANGELNGYSVETCQ